MTDNVTFALNDYANGFEPDSIEEVLDSWLGSRLLHEGDDPDPMVFFPDEEGKVQTVLPTSLEGGTLFTRATDFGVFAQLRGTVAGDWLLWCSQLVIRDEPPFCTGLVVSRDGGLRLWLAVRDDSGSPSPWFEAPPEALDEENGFLSSLPFDALRACFTTGQPTELTLPAGLDQIEHAWVRHCLVQAATLPPALLAVAQEAGQLHEEAEKSKVGRNEPCPCGSGTKFKKCCGGAS